MTDMAPSGFSAATPVTPRIAGKRLRHVCFTAIAAFILLGPAPGQLFGKTSPWLREWVMFSGVGVGIPKGQFTVNDANGSDQGSYTPLAAAGLDRYPRMSHYRFENRVFASGDMAGFAAPLCASLAPGQHVSFEGWVGTRQGWAEMSIETVCAMQGDTQ